MQTTSQALFVKRSEPIGVRRLRSYKAIWRRLDECVASLRGLYAVPWQKYKPEVRRRILRAEQLRRQLETIIDQTDRALSELNDPQTRVIYGLYFDKETPYAMACALGCSLAKIHGIRRGALHKLNAALRRNSP